MQGDNCRSNPFTVTIMENSQTDSFQHELEDFIRKQRARGLNPRICFREPEEDSSHQEREYLSPKPLVLGSQLPFRRPPKTHAPYERLKTLGHQVPHWPGVHSYPQRSLGHSWSNHPHFFRSPWFRSPDPSQEHHSGVWPSDPEDRDPRSRERMPEGVAVQECKDASHKKDRILSSRKTKAEPAAAEKPPHRKKKTRQDRASPKEGRSRSHKEKQRLSQRDLWDEAILGGC